MPIPLEGMNALCTCRSYRPAGPRGKLIYNSYPLLLASAMGLAVMQDCKEVYMIMHVQLSIGLVSTDDWQCYLHAGWA